MTHSRGTEQVVGKSLSEDVYDNFGRLLLSKGMTLTPNVVEMLSKRNVDIRNAVKMGKKGNSSKGLDLSLEKHVAVLHKNVKFIEKNGHIKPQYIQFGQKLLETALSNMVKQDPLLNSHLSAFYSQMYPVYTHIIRVTFISSMIGVEYGQSGANLKEIVVGGLLHDIGRLMVPSFTNKGSQLTVGEMQLVKQHALIGSHFLLNIGLPEGVWKAAGQHHESYNGRGYPNAISGEEIHINAQIIRLADVFDALTSVKAYQNPQGLQKAIEIIVQRRDTDFNADIVESFVNLWEFK